MSRSPGTRDHRPALVLWVYVLAINAQPSPWGALAIAFGAAVLLAGNDVHVG